jgi:hypothetical protein
MELGDNTRSGHSDHRLAPEGSTVFAGAPDSKLASPSVPHASAESSILRLGRGGVWLSLDVDCVGRIEF